MLKDYLFFSSQKIIRCKKKFKESKKKIVDEVGQKGVGWGWVPSRGSGCIIRPHYRILMQYLNLS